MNELWKILDNPALNGGTFTPESVLLSLLLAFVLGQALAWVYYFTHNGLSYSRSYVQSLVLITVVVAIVMSVIGNNIITAFGLLGALAIVRFRNVVKDTRDIVFIFSALVVGMGVGSQRYSIAIIGTVILSLIAIYLHLTDFGSHRPHNGFLRFNMQGYIDPKHDIISILKRFCSKFTLISVHENGLSGSGVEYAYQLMIRNTKNNEKMMEELKSIVGVSDLNLTIQEQLLEV